MDASQVLQERLPRFAGYADLPARRLTDEEVRAYLGERLAALSMRLMPTGPSADHLNALQLRTEFTNQHAQPFFDSESLDVAHAQAVADADLATVELADRSDSVSNLDMLPKYLDETQAVLDARDRAMESSKG
ncbi:MAG TPA: hypothetical protein VF741_07460 [Candidatus Aquilonibacter sp.]